MTAVEAAIAEINERLAAFAPELEGLRDYYRLNLHDDTKAEVAAFIVLYETRVSLLTDAKNRLEALMADGHPDLPIREVSASELLDLQGNAATIEAALKRFAANTATSMAFAKGPVELK